MSKIISVYRREGVYNNRPWANYQITTVSEENRENLYGLYVESHKVPCHVLDQFLTENHREIKSIINHDMTVYYNKYGTVQNINIS